MRGPEKRLACARKVAHLLGRPFMGASCSGTHVQARRCQTDAVTERGQAPRWGSELLLAPSGRTRVAPWPPTANMPGKLRATQEPPLAGPLTSHIFHHARAATQEPPLGLADLEAASKGAGRGSGPAFDRESISAEKRTEGPPPKTRNRAN